MNMGIFLQTQPQKHQMLITRALTRKTDSQGKVQSAFKKTKEMRRRERQSGRNRKKKKKPRSKLPIPPLPRPRPRQRQPLQRGLHPPTQPRPLLPHLQISQPTRLLLFRLSNRPRALLQHIRDRHAVRETVKAGSDHLGVGSERLELIGLAHGLSRALALGFEQRFISRA